MFSARSFRPVLLAALAIGVMSAPALAQQRIQIGELIQRIDRLETEVVRLRVEPRAGGGGDVVRLDQIEQELRRLTGIIERLEFENRESAKKTDARLTALEDRLGSAESGRTVAVAPPSASVGPPVAPSQPQFGAQPVYSPSALASPAPFDQQPTFAPQTPQTFGQQAAPTSTQSPDALYDDGLRLLNIGSFDQAGARFEDLIATYPQDPKAGQAQYWLGDMHFKLGRFEQAATAFLDSFRNWPEGAKAPDSLLKLGMTLANIGKIEEACLSFMQVPARYPSAPPSLLRRADIEGQRNRCGS